MINITVLGETDIGKTSMIRRLGLKEYQIDEPRTVGITNFTYEMNNNIYNICDVCGDMRFISLAKLFIKNANIIILAYNTTNRESFNRLKDFWIKEVKNYQRSEIGRIISNMIL